MTILRVDIRGDRPVPADLSRLDAALDAAPERVPLTLMLHGFRYAPDDPRHNPHDHILGPVGGPGRSLSWPRHLGFREGRGPGLAIALGWYARGTIWDAHATSSDAAEAFAWLLTRLHLRSPRRRIVAIGHSLGARVILRALPGVPPGALSRAVLLSAAAFRAETQAALDSPAGAAAGFVNVTSRENDLFDAMLEMMLPGSASGSIGHGLGTYAPNWIDLQLDHPEVIRGLARLGFPVGPPARRICHWSAYRRPGVFALYRALLTDPVLMPLELLAEALPTTQEPRWTRLLALPWVNWPLPFRRGASS